MSKSIGLPHGKVILLPHSEEWKLLFEEERDFLQTLLGSHVLEIHHIGSTSVPDLSAKPIIDILVVLHQFSTMEILHAKMEALGYLYRQHDSNEHRTLFAKDQKEKTTHHIHFTEAGSEEWEKAFAFWDYMRTHPEEVRAYENLKQELAAKHPLERDKYSKGKAGFIQSIIEKSKRLKTKIPS